MAAAYKRNSPMFQEMMNAGVARFNDAGTGLLKPDGTAFAGGGGGGVTPTTDPNILYGTDDEGAPFLYPVLPTEQGSAVALRTPEAQLRADTVPDDDPAAANGDLVNRQYLAGYASDNLVAKTLNANTIYGTDDVGGSKEYGVATGPESGLIAQRTSVGQLQVVWLPDNDVESTDYDAINRTGLRESQYTATQPLVESQVLDGARNAKILRNAGVADYELTIEAGLPAGFNFKVLCVGAGRVSLVAGAGVTFITPGNAIPPVAPITEVTKGYASVQGTIADEYVLTGWVEP